MEYEQRTQDDLSKANQQLSIINSELTKAKSEITTLKDKSSSAVMDQPLPSTAKTDEEAVLAALVTYLHAMKGNEFQSYDVRIATDGDRKLMNSNFANAVYGQISRNILKRIDGQ